MSDDNSDEIMIGPMPAVEEYAAMTLTTTEPEDNTEGTTLTGRGTTTTTTINQHHHNNNTNGFDNNTDYDYQDNTSVVGPPSPQALFFLSEMGECLDVLTYDPHILQLAETNKVDIPWTDLKPIIRDTILKQCDAMETIVTDTEVQSIITGIKTNILHCIDHHSGAPFTIQRLCELISAPTRHYTLFIKYLHAIEKVLSVASTWDSFCEETPTSAPSAPSPSQQHLENDLYTGYEMPDVVLTPRFDGDIDLDEGDEDDEDDDDEEDDDVVDEIETEEVDSMEMDSTPADHQDSQVNGTLTMADNNNNNNNNTDAMEEDDKDMDQDLEQDHQVPSNGNQ